MGVTIRMGVFRMIASAFLVASVGLLLCCGLAAASNYEAFGDPQAVSIEGYSGSAMEPFISQDGQYLLFNTSNVAPSTPALQVATRVDAQTFSYQGEIQGEGVNEPNALSGTPTMDQNGNLYFISPRSYSQTLSTIYSGQFLAGQVTRVHLVSGISGGVPGLVDFDVSTSPDGSTLYVSVGDFSSGSGPTSASLAIFDKVGSSFVPDPHSAAILHAVNVVGVLTYAASISSDGLELFFTRANPPGVVPSIYRAARSSTGLPFAHVQRVGAITGFTEAPSLSADGTTLYYHRLVDDRFEIASVQRVSPTSPTVARVSPRKGPAAGGTAVTITGTNLTGATAVRFGTAQATEVQLESASEITAISPPGATGTVDLTVTTANGTSASTAKDHFGFRAPTVTGVSPGGGSVAGGNTVTVTGSGFAPGTTATAFKFGRTLGSSVNCTSTTTCTVIVPAGKAGVVDVTAIVSNKSSSKNPPADGFSYS